MALTLKDRRQRDKDRRSAAHEKALRYPNAWLDDGGARVWLLGGDPTRLRVSMWVRTAELQDRGSTEEKVLVARELYLDNPVTLSRLIHALSCRLNAMIERTNQTTAAASSELASCRLVSLPSEPIDPVSTQDLK